MLNSAETRVLFTFFDAKPPHQQIQQIKLENEGYEAAMIVKDERRKTQQEHDNFMAVLFKINADVNPCKLIKLIKGTETRLIESTESFTPDEFHMESQFLNCFRCDPSMAILCTWYKVFFVSDLMHCLNEVNLEQVDKSISMITAMRKAYKIDEE